MFPLYYRLIGRLCPIKLEVPDSKGKAVILSFDVETLPNAGNRRELSMEYDDFIPRLLDVLDSFSVKAHYFVCGESCRVLSGVILFHSSKGHGLGGHGYIHERLIGIPYYAQREMILHAKM